MRATSGHRRPHPAGGRASPAGTCQYGYGRPNVCKAMHAIHAGDIPPVAWIDSPEWYSLYDPTTTSSVPVTGHVEPRRDRAELHVDSSSSRPAPSPPTPPSSPPAPARAARRSTARSARIDLSQVPASFWNAAFAPLVDKALETTEQYTVTLRLRVTDRGPRRRGAPHDRRAPRPDAAGGLPEAHRSGRREPAGARRPPGHRDSSTSSSATPTASCTRSTRDAAPSCPGWPVHTDPTVVVKSHAGIDPGYEPILSNVAVGDLSAQRLAEVVATVDDRHASTSSTPTAAAGRLAEGAQHRRARTRDPAARRCRSRGCRTRARPPRPCSPT